MSSQKPFKNLKVVELASVLAGPAVGMFFAELGAKVMKVENKLTKGDVTRTWKLPIEDKNNPASAYYASVNWNKKVVWADLNSQPEREKIYQLIRKADVVIANYKLGVDQKLGMDYRTIKKINPAIIYASINGFGAKSKRIAYDVVLQAESGFMYMNGTPKHSPIKMPVALIDLIAAHQLKQGILVALLKKAKTGKGAKVTVSLMDAAIASLANQSSAWLNLGLNPQPIGTLHPNIAPYGELFLTKDKRQIVLAVGTNEQFIKLCTVLNEKKLAEDSLYSTNQKRVKNRIKLADILQTIFKKRNALLLMHEFENKGVPAGIVKSVAQVFEEENAKKLIVKQGEWSNTRTAVFKIT
jgi:crotonobetainyl-CoA:carnitine CoA-transferase CaiB-like acyl-CoA transferase